VEDHLRQETARESAVKTLGKIGATDAVPVQTEALADKNPQLRLATAHVLRRVGSAARIALPALVRA
jgi:HEAT repeat protein